MTLWFHSTILAVSLAASVAVGLASASVYKDAGSEAAAKTDRLPVIAEADTTFMTVETRADGMSVLSRLPVSDLN